MSIRDLLQKHSEILQTPNFELHCKLCSGVEKTPLPVFLQVEQLLI